MQIIFLTPAPLPQPSGTVNQPSEEPIMEIDTSLDTEPESYYPDDDGEMELSDVDLAEKYSMIAIRDKLIGEDLRAKSAGLASRIYLLNNDQMKAEFFRSDEDRVELLNAMRQVLASKAIDADTVSVKENIVKFACAQEFGIKSDILGHGTVSLANAKLRNLNFSGVNLSLADLSGADLTDSNLSETNLFRANLKDANLTRTNLCRTNLCKADLSGSNLTRAFLEAYLIRANLDNAILDGVDLSLSDFAHVHCRRFTKDRSIFDAFDPVAGLDSIFLSDENENSVNADNFYKFSQTWKKSTGKRRVVDFEWEGLGTKFANQNSLQSTSLIDMDGLATESESRPVSHRKSIGRDFLSADFRADNVRNSDFRGSDLRHANFGSELEHPYPTCATSRQALTDLMSTSPHLKSVDAENSDFRWTRLDSASFQAANVRNADFRGADLRRTNFVGADLRGANFHGADLKRAVFAMANLSGVDFSGMDLRGIDFSGADLSGANFTGAKMDGAILRNADLRGIKIDGSNFAKVNVTGANLSNFNFAGMDLTGVRFVDANLSGANFIGATVNGTTAFNRADLTGANFFFIDRPADAIIPQTEVLVAGTGALEPPIAVPAAPTEVVQRNVAPPAIPPRRQSIWSWLSDVPIRIGSFFRSIFLGMFRPPMR